MLAIDLDKTVNQNARGIRGRSSRSIVLESMQAGGGRPAVDLPRGHSGRGRATSGATGGKWKAYPSVSQVWRRNWARITPFFNYPPDIRRAIYTTNRVESLNRSLRKIIKTRGGFATNRQH